MGLKSWSAKTHNLTIETYRYLAKYLVCLLLFYTLSTVLPLYHGGDMLHEMKRGEPEPTLLLIQGVLSSVSTRAFASALVLRP